MNMRVISLLLVTTLIFQIVSAEYDNELNCDINIMPYDFEELVNTKSFNFTITLTNIGNLNLSASNINVSIYTPNNEILENYYTFILTMPALNVNESVNLTHYFNNEKNRVSLYETPIEGAWKMELIFTQTPFDTIVHSDRVIFNNRCKKYFVVRDITQFEQEKKQEQLTKESDIKTEELNKSIILLTIILGSELLWKIAKKLKHIIIFFMCIAIGIWAISYSYNINPLKELEIFRVVSVIIILLEIIIHIGLLKCKCDNIKNFLYFVLSLVIGYFVYSYFKIDATLTAYYVMMILFVNAGFHVLIKKNITLWIFGCLYFVMILSISGIFWQYIDKMQVSYILITIWSLIAILTTMSFLLIINDKSS